MVVTSYKYLRQGQSCQRDEEFDCSTTQNFLSSNTDHMCLSIKLACDGIPSCGQDYLPNMDENCFKVTIYSPCIYFRNINISKLNMLVFNLIFFTCFQIHWSSVLLSLVSYALLALLLILILGLFVCVVIRKCSHAESNINSSPKVLEKTNRKTNSTAIEADFCSSENQKVC